MTTRTPFITLALILCLSCAKQQAVPQEQEARPLMLVVSLEGGAKTVLADERFGDVEWCAGDAIGVYASVPDTPRRFVTSKGGATAEFTGQAPSSSRYYGLYPFDLNSSLREDASIQTVLPCRQTACPGTFDPSAFLCAGTSSTQSLPFYNICGGIRISVQRTDIDRVILRGNADESLAGQMTISFNADGRPTAVPSAQGEKAVELRSDTPLSAGSLYYVSLIPQSLERGLTMEFYNGQTLVAKTSTEALIEVGRSSFNTIRNADNAESVSSITGGHDLSENGNANCYIVSAPGNYSLPVVAGPSSVGLSKAVSADVLWETTNTTSAPRKGELIESVTFKNNVIYFSTPRRLRSGNALIVAKNKYGDVLWSWHIWICEGYDPASTAQTYPGKTFSVMDRNIGALSAMGNLSCGLFYQWGRKDPFPGAVSLDGNAFFVTTGTITSAVSSESVGTNDYAIANPTCFITASTQSESTDWLYTKSNTQWNATSKTMYDPCPPGWRVPPDEKTGASLWRDIEFASATRGFILASASSVWYPCNGYVSSGSYSLERAGKAACYWSGSAGKALRLDLDGKSASERVVQVYSGCGRAEGHSVRCIKQ